MRGPEKWDPTEERGKGVSQNADEQHSRMAALNSPRDDQSRGELRAPGNQNKAFCIIVRRKLCSGRVLRRISKIYIEN